MYLVYIDDSGDNDIAAFSAIMIPEEHWHDAFRRVKLFRQYLKRTYGIYIKKEFHANKFVTGRGKISDRIVTKYDRCRIFDMALCLITTFEGALILNAISDKAHELRLFERLLNRINRTAEANGQNCILISDEGKEHEYSKLRRKMGVFNQIPSMYGGWEDGAFRNLPLNNTIEDIVFKDSKSSWFIQLADFVAYSLFRMEYQIPSRNYYGIHKSFSILDPVLVKVANRFDTLGIIRA